MKKTALWIALLVSLSGIAQAAGNITSVSVVPANPALGQTVKFKVTTSSQNECWAIVSLQHASFNFGVLAFDAHVTKAADSGETFTTALTNPGTYTVVAGAGSDKNPKCSGQANLSFNVAAPDVGTITGVTVIPANPTLGQTVKFKVTTSSQNECWAIVSLQHASFNFGVLAFDAHVTKAADSGETFTTALTNPGTYAVVAAGSDKNPNCKGKANLTFEVKNTALLRGATSAMVAGPTECPAPYLKTTAGDDTAKGEFHCIKDAACPVNFEGRYRNPKTGELVCTPKIIDVCPEGWTGGPVNGQLICTSKAQPSVTCPSVPSWTWGTTYYKENWNIMGCRANSKPAY